MNELIVDVKIWGKNVGSLYWEKESEATVFDYEKRFLRSGLDISPIVMPLREFAPGRYKFRKVLGTGC